MTRPPSAGGAARNRINLACTERMLSRFEALRVAMDAASATEVVRRSTEVAEWLLEMQQQGRTVYAEDPDGGRVQLPPIGP